MTTGDPAVQRVELSVGDATRALTPDQVRDIIATLTGRQNGGNRHMSHTGHA
jgi:hypothetical protein